MDKSDETEKILDEYEKSIMVHLWHPCRGIDIWAVQNEEQKRMAKSQGYLPLEHIRNCVRRKRK